MIFIVGYHVDFAAVDTDENEFSHHFQVRWRRSDSVDE